MTQTETGPTRFADLGLREEILRAITDSGYETPTPIQARAIPEVLKGRDVVGIAQTGTGKTASFTLPMIEKLAAGRARARMPRSLILSPTRELATQTARNFEVYGKYLKLSMALLIGGVGMGDQEKALEKGVDVLIATPGRLLDWFERGRILLGGVQILVIDEADRMLDMGFIPDVERITTLLVKREQTLLFSATFAKEIRRLAQQFMNDPIEIEVARPASTNASVEDRIVEVGLRDKFKVLRDLIRTEGVEKAIIFANRKRDVSSLNRHLQRSGYNAKDIHGDLDQPQRQATLDAFKAGTVDLLVATDVAARGLDISDMPVVINYDVPTHAEDYVHRIGRTGRAGKKGRAFTLLMADEAKYLSSIEQLMKRQVVRYEVAAAESAVTPAAAVGAAEDAPAKPRRRRAARSDAPVAEIPPVVAPTETSTAAESAASAPPRRRRRAKADVEPSAASVDAVEAAPAPVAQPAVQRPARDAAVVDRSADDRSGADRGRDRRPRERRPERRPEERRPEERGEQPIGPVVAFGDLIPAFMLQPIPQVGAPAGDED